MKKAFSILLILILSSALSASSASPVSDSVKVDLPLVYDFEAFFVEDLEDVNAETGKEQIKHGGSGKDDSLGDYTGRFYIYCSTNAVEIPVLELSWGSLSTEDKATIDMSVYSAESWEYSVSGDSGKAAVITLDSPDGTKVEIDSDEYGAPLRSPCYIHGVENESKGQRDMYFRIVVAISAEDYASALPGHYESEFTLMISGA